MPDLTLQSPCSLMSVPTACTSLMTRWRVICGVTAIRKPLPSLAISIRKSRPCYATVQAKAHVQDTSGHSHGLGSFHQGWRDKIQVRQLEHRYMTTFVLVHGAWYGGWCYKRVA